MNIDYILPEFHFFNLYSQKCQELLYSPGNTQDISTLSGLSTFKYLHFIYNTYRDFDSIKFIFTFSTTSATIIHKNWTSILHSCDLVSTQKINELSTSLDFFLIIKIFVKCIYIPLTCFSLLIHYQNVNAAIDLLNTLHYNFFDVFLKFLLCVIHKIKIDPILCTMMYTNSCYWFMNMIQNIQKIHKQLPFHEEIKLKIIDIFEKLNKVTTTDDQILSMLLEKIYNYRKHINNIH